MSGNYDYPPASRRISRRTGPDERRYQHLRNLLGSVERNQDSDHFNLDRALEVLSEEIEESWAEGQRWNSNFEQTRAMVDRQIHQIQSDLSGREDRIRRIMSSHERSENLSVPTPPSMNQEQGTSDSPPPAERLSRRRRVLTPGERFMRDGRGRRSGLSTLLDEPFPPLHPLPAAESSSSMRPDLEAGRQSGRWSTKRRKLDSDDNREGPRGFSYGQHGQVVPGALKMEIASCDGGTYEPEGESSWPENVLHNDSSVYCTKSDRCNLILRHRGETPFCLKKLIIKAPKVGFDAPIQEGMVFVSMTSDELLTRTAHYQTRRRRQNRRALRASQEQLNAFRSPFRSLERTSVTGRDFNPVTENELATVGRRDGHMADFRVTTAYDDNSDAGGNGDVESDEDIPSIAEIERIHMEQMEDDLPCPESDDSESDDDLSVLSTLHRRRLELRRRSRIFHHQESPDDHVGLQSRRPYPSSIGPVGSFTQGSSSYYTGSNSQSGAGALEPHAHFFIEQEKSMVSIKFDPPPSGRFILIKLWSPYTGGNIDIQSIIAHGFAGPRFFPAGNFR